MTPDFWKDRRVFVTGHTGFKGSWLTVWLRRMGAHVTGFALPPPSAPAMFHLADVAEGITSLEGDVRDLPALRAALGAAEPEIVLHLAAQALVKTAYADPVTTFTTNVVGTLHVLEAVRQTPSVRVVVCITSDKCYENSEWVWGYRENDPMGGRDPYSSSKGCAELLISSYRDSYFPPAQFERHRVGLASVRAGNVIGGGDWSADRLVPDMMRAIMDNRPVLIRRPHAVRPWQFVLEPLRGYLDLAERLWAEPASFAGAWNFGPEAEQIKPVEWVVEYLVQRWGVPARWMLDGDDHPHEHHLLRLDATKAKTLLGWKPLLDLPTVLDWVVEWYRAAHAEQDLRALTEAQIARYESLLAPLSCSHHELPVVPVLPLAPVPDLRGSGHGPAGQRLLAR